MFVLLMPEQGKKTHDQDQSAYPSNQKIGNEAKFYQWLVEEEIMADFARIKYLRVALQAVGVIFIVGIYRLVVALGAVTPLATLSADDSWRLCDIGCFSVDRKPKPARKPESYLVHGVVQRRARRNHGGTSLGEPRANRPPLG